MSVHLYYTENWAQKSVLAGLPVIIGAPNAANLTSLLLETVGNFGDLSNEQLARKVVMMAADGASVLQGHLNGVIVRVQEEVGPFLLGMHCHAHRADLAGATISECLLMQHLISLINAAYNLFHRVTVTNLILVCMYYCKSISTQICKHHAALQVIWPVLRVSNGLSGVHGQ